jgi:hypothetical protein
MGFTCLSISIPFHIEPRKGSKIIHIFEKCVEIISAEILEKVSLSPLKDGTPSLRVYVIRVLRSTEIKW